MALTKPARGTAMSRAHRRAPASLSTALGWCYSGKSPFHAVSPTADFAMGCSVSSLCLSSSRAALLRSTQRFPQ